MSIPKDEQFGLACVFTTISIGLIILYNILATSELPGVMVAEIVVLHIIAIVVGSMLYWREGISIFRENPTQDINERSIRRTMELAAEPTITDPILKQYIADQFSIHQSMVRKIANESLIKQGNSNCSYNPDILKLKSNP